MICPRLIGGYLCSLCCVMQMTSKKSLSFNSSGQVMDFHLYCELCVAVRWRYAGLWTGAVPNSATYNWWFGSSFAWTGCYSLSVGYVPVELVHRKERHDACIDPNRGYSWRTGHKITATVSLHGLWWWRNKASLHLQPSVTVFSGTWWKLAVLHLVAKSALHACPRCAVWFHNINTQPATWKSKPEAI